MDSDEDSTMKMKKKLRSIFMNFDSWKKNQFDICKQNYIHEEMVANQISAEIKINEADILEDEKFLIEKDIYSLTITTLMTG